MKLKKILLYLTWTNTILMSNLPFTSLPTPQGALRIGLHSWARFLCIRALPSFPVRS